MVSADNGYVVLDIEGNKKDPRADPDSLTLGFSYAYKRSYKLVSGYIPINHYADNVPVEYLQTFEAVLKTRKVKPICYNIKYDGVAFKNNLGIDILSLDFYDIMLMIHQVNENLISYKLKDTSPLYGGTPKYSNEVSSELGEVFGYSFIPINLMTDYATNDAIIEYELFEKVLKEYKRQFPDRLWETERDWVRFIIDVEACGVSLDHDFIESEIAIGDKRLDAITDALGGNPGSPKFLANLLFVDLGLPVVKTSLKTGKPSFDKEAMAKYDELLQEQDSDTARRILEYRGWTKTLSSNYRAYLELESPDKRLRPNYKIHGTTSSRLSCEKPNLQQIPRESDKRWNGSLKKAFIPKEEYKLWEFDYANLELRVMAIYARQENLLEQLRKGFKPFDVMAEQLGWPRQNVKTFNYMTSFGAGIDKIAGTFRIPFEESKEMRTDYFRTYPGFLDFSYAARDAAASRGYVRLWTGRRCHFPYVYVPEKGRKLRVGTHKAMNRIVQGGAAELVKYAGITLRKKIDWRDCTINLQIHDAYVAEIKIGTEDTWIPIIKETMENVSAFNPEFGQCPFPVEVKEWGK